MQEEQPEGVRRGSRKRCAAVQGCGERMDEGEEEEEEEEAFAVRSRAVARECAEAVWS